MPTTAPVPATRYAVVGVGHRSFMYCEALLARYRQRHALVGMCDVNRTRLELRREEYRQRYGADVPIYAEDGFERMLAERRVECVIVTSIDRTHHDYIIRAMDAGCDVICEKPMTIDPGKLLAIRAAIARTGRRLRVTFNYRYSPLNSRVREVIASGAIGEVLSLHFEWTLDISHGADYFRRWHRDMRNSGGLMVHKASHHFDLVNWWLASRPQTVFAMGDLRFYGRANADERGWGHRYDLGTGHPNAAGDPWAVDLARDEWSRRYFHEASRDDGYRRDQNVFGDGISIQDDMAVVVRYRNRAVMTYHLNAYAPWEGHRVMFNGTGGRLELVHEDNVTSKGDFANDPRMANYGAEDTQTVGAVKHLLVRPLRAKPYLVPWEVAVGGHGGGDSRLLDDLFIGGTDDPLGRAADHEDGTWSSVTGFAANRSMETGLPVRCADLLSDDWDARA